MPQVEQSALELRYRMGRVGESRLPSFFGERSRLEDRPLQKQENGRLFSLYSAQEAP